MRATRHLRRAPPATCDPRHPPTASACLPSCVARLPSCAAHPRGVRGSGCVWAQLVTFKQGEKEGFVGKIHDEELVEQQLETAWRKMSERLKTAEGEAANPFNKELERLLAHRTS